MQAFAAGEAMENYCDKQNNEEAIYDGSYWVQPSRWNADPIDPNEYKGEARVWIDKIEVAIDEALAADYIEIDMNCSGVQDSVSSVGFHILYDTRLTPVNVGRKQIAFGDSLADFSPVITSCGAGLVNCVGSASDNYINDGTMLVMRFKVPENAQVGDIYPVGVRYQYDGVTGDLFADKDINYKTDVEGRLLMAYIFSNGIENGYIKITANPEPAVSNGDPSGDGVIDGTDATRVLKMFAALANAPKDEDGNAEVDFTQEEMAAADVDGDGTVDGSDATLILKYYGYLGSLQNGEEPTPLNEFVDEVLGR
jgi:hypothetical protein